MSLRGGFAIVVCSGLASLQLARGADGDARSIVPIRADRAPLLDGTLEDPLWLQQAPITKFYQREPLEKESATERTEVRVLYDRHNLYFGIHCFDSEPRKITATELRRDTDFSVDDSFTILISPTNDKRNGYTFTVNPLGTQFDSLINDEGRVNDPFWDGVWKSNARLVADGWTATVAIPFATLNFKTSDDVTMGINFRRFIRHKNEEDLWQAYLRIFGIERIAEAGELAGLKDIGSGRLLIVKPYVAGGVTSNTQTGTQWQHTGGLDIKYGLRSSLVANLTFNTDFADADVDPVRFNITPFKLSLPEKRQFFLENGGVFQFGIPDTTQLFFSRQIGIDPDTGLPVPLDAGVKLTGSVGNYDIGILDVKTRSSGAIPYANYLVTRVKRKVFAESYIGGIFIDKRNGNPHDPFNRSAGIDANFLFFERLSFYGYVARTFSFNPASNGQDWSHSIGAQYKSNLLKLEASRTLVQANFNPEVGFVDRTDLKTNYLDTQFTPRPQAGPVRELSFEASYQHQTDTHGVLQTNEWEGAVGAVFHNGSYTDNDLVTITTQRLLEPFVLFGNVAIPTGLYRFTRRKITYGSDPSKRLFFSALERFGGYYNGTLNVLQGELRYRPKPRVSLSASEAWNVFHFGEDRYNVHVSSFNASYSFNRLITTSVLVQENSIDRNPVSLNLRLRYNYRPDSDFYVIYNVGSQFNSIAAGNPVLLRESRLSIKLSRSFLR
jgi:Domain of unknown function (DUF5916)/Carbohydrate family 9 binding domain-like